MKRFSIVQPLNNIAIAQIQNNSAINQLQALTKPFASLTAASQIFQQQKEMNEKLKHIFSPAWEQAAVFKQFHDQTSAIAKILNPSVADFIQKNVRTSFTDVTSISAIEAIYLETFEQVDDNFDQEALQEFSDKLAKHPSWVEFLISLATPFKKSYLGNEFTEAVTKEITKKFKIKNPVIVSSLVMLIFLYITVIQPKTAEIQQEQENEIRDEKIASSEQQTKQLKSENRKDRVQQKQLIRRKETFFRQLNKSVELFEKELSMRYKKPTVRKYTRIAAEFVDYIHNHTGYTSLDKVKQNDITNFIASVKHDNLNCFHEPEIRNKLNTFLEYHGTSKLQKNITLKSK